MTNEELYQQFHREYKDKTKEEMVDVLYAFYVSYVVKIEEECERLKRKQRAHQMVVTGLKKQIQELKGETPEEKSTPEFKEHQRRMNQKLLKEKRELQKQVQKLNAEIYKLKLGKEILEKYE